LNQVVQCADGHFAFTPGAISIFQFVRSHGVVSIAESPSDIPQLYDTGKDYFRHTTTLKTARG
jgi:hypothetical protein